LAEAFRFCNRLFASDGQAAPAVIGCRRAGGEVRAASTGLPDD